MINFSWTHSGIWSIAKLVASKVYNFHTLQLTTYTDAFSRLMHFLESFSLSRKSLSATSHHRLYHKAFHTANMSLAHELTALIDYGGVLEPLSTICDSSQGSQISPSSQSASTPETTYLSPIPGPSSLSPTSMINPFFGYPVSVTGTSASLHYGRRRKRDLAKTLMLLLWLRWRRRIMACFWLGMFALAVRLWSRRWLLRSPKGLALLQAFWSSCS